METVDSFRWPGVSTIERKKVNFNLKVIFPNEFIFEKKWLFSTLKFRKDTLFFGVLIFSNEMEKQLRYGPQFSIEFGKNAVYTEKYGYIFSCHER